MCHRLATLLAVLAVARTAVSQTQCTNAEAATPGFGLGLQIATVTGIYNNTCWQLGCVSNTCEAGCLVCADGSYVGASFAGVA
jgi:hypothetical protein